MENLEPTRKEKIELLEKVAKNKKDYADLGEKTPRNEFIAKHVFSLGMSLGTPFFFTYHVGESWHSISSLTEFGFEYLSKLKSEDEFELLERERHKREKEKLKLDYLAIVISVSALIVSIMSIVVSIITYFLTH